MNEMKMRWAGNLARMRRDELCVQEFSRETLREKFNCEVQF